jgi:metallo-beta-lactamase family protein
MVRVFSCGAAGEVTGSMHVVQFDGKTLVLDCGMFQGRRAEADAKNREYNLPLDKVDALILSHAHIDHSGRLPRLVRDGYRNAIYATPATRDLCTVMLADSAHIQQEDTKFVNKKRVRNGELPIEPLYSQQDALDTIPLFRTISYYQAFEPTPGVTARFFEVGHMLGSAGVHLLIDQPGRRALSLVYTGDLGRPNMPLLRDPAPLPDCDVLLTESTYGNRKTEGVELAKQRLADVVLKTIEHKGKVIVPAFSVGRTQVIVYFLHQLFEEGLLPKVPVYVDSPLSVNTTEIFKLHPECFDSEARAFDRLTNGNMFGGDCCTYIRDVEESKRLNAIKDPCIILSASGMCETGRILHHLANNIDNPRNTILIVGFQAANTLGRRLVEKAKQVRIFGEPYDVKARVAVINGFSAHADCDELDDTVRPQAGNCRTALLVHGEPDQQQAFAQRMQTMGYKDVRLMERGQVVEV